jgi:hypothetical protein
MSRVVGRVYIRSNRLLVNLVRGMNAVHNGLWLGLLKRDELNFAIATAYGGQDYLDAVHNEFGLWDWERRAIEAWFPDSGRLLVGAAGGGREALDLARRGYDVCCFDCMPPFVESARALLKSHVSSDNVLLADLDCVPDVTGPFDGLIVGWGAYSHIKGSARRVAFLKQFRSVAPVGTPLLLSFHHRGGSERFLSVTHRVATVVYRVIGRGERPELGDVVAGSFVHRFTREEMEAELSASGFECVYCSGTPYWHAVARAV